MAPDTASPIIATAKWRRNAECASKGAKPAVSPLPASSNTTQSAWRHSEGSYRNWSAGRRVPATAALQSR